MAPRTFALLISGAVLVLSIILLSVPVHATTAGGSNVACGNGWTTNMSAAADASNVSNLTAAMEADEGLAGLAGQNSLDGYEQQCASSLSSRRGWGFGLLGVGVVALLGSAVVRRPAAAGPAAPAV